MFKKEVAKDYYLLTTSIENMFISEVLPEIDPKFLKVYVYSLMAAENGIDLYITSLSDILKMKEEEINSAFRYFEGKGLLRREENDIVFTSLREKLYGNIDKETVKVDNFTPTNELSEIINSSEKELGRTLNGNEIQEITAWVNTVHATKDTILSAINFCVEKGKSNVKYIEKVVIDWTDNGLDTKEKIIDYLKSSSERQGMYKRIVSSLGFNRNATDAEKELIDIWLDSWNFNIERILDACKKTISTANPNLKYVDKVLSSWKDEAEALGTEVNNTLSVSQVNLKEYFEHLRDEAREKAEERKEEVYTKVPRIREIDKELNELAIKISTGLLRGLSKDDVEVMKEKVKSLENERAATLTDNSFDMNYTDIRYICEDCKDTGIDDNGARCKCVTKRIGEASIWQRGQQQNK